MSGRVTILHLSDFHFSQQRRWDADPVLSDLSRAIARDVQEEGLVPDVVAVTGDIADKGREVEYQAAAEWIETRLLPALPAGFRRDRLLMVPGNHDVDRSCIDEAAEGLQDRLLGSRDQQRIANVLGDAYQRDVLLRRHAAYLKFARTYRRVPDGQPWFSEIVEVDGIRIHFAGLCTSWMSSSDGDHGRLLLGRFQVNRVLADADQAQLSVALMHHPWSYLAEFDGDELEAAIHRSCRLTLRGHLHRTSARCISYPDKQSIELAAGAAYSGSDYPNAFQWIALDLHDRELMVHFRTWANGRWIVDRNQVPGSPHGAATFRIAAAVNPPAASPGSSPFSQLVDELVVDFCGRRFLDQALDGFLESHDRGYFTLEGEPGIGKSAWAAHVIATRGCIHHFNIEAEGIVRIDQAQRTLCAQLIERHLPRATVDLPAGPGDSELLKSLLERASAALESGERILIVVDALDEAVLPRPGENVLCLPRRLPAGVYFLLTTRPVSDRLLVTDGPQARFVIDAWSASNREDARDYAAAFLRAHPAVRQRYAADYPDDAVLAGEIEARSEGNFMYLRHVLPELERGDVNVGDLPVGLMQYYESHWHKMKSRDPRMWSESQRPVLSVLAAITEAVTIEDICSFAGSDSPRLAPAGVASVLAEWRPFLRTGLSEAGQRRHSIYHKSFREFLRKMDEIGEIDLAASHGHIADALRRALDTWKSGSNRP